jgi:plasmid maintenance system antidote protein VapI
MPGGQQTLCRSTPFDPLRLKMFTPGEISCSKGTTLIRVEGSMARKSESERFFAKVKKRPGGCWEWQATCTRGPDGGYGVFYAEDPGHKKKRNMPAHRWSYLHHHGPIPPGMIVMHTCDQRGCVNPKHLQLGTLRDNALDMVRKNRWGGPSGEGHFNTKLTSRQVEEIRRRYAAGEAYQHQLAQEYGVRQSTIGRIVRGEVWAEAGGPVGPGPPHRGGRHHHAKLSTDQVHEMRKKYAAGGSTQRQLAEMFGVSANHVGEILRGNKRKEE